MKLLTKEEEEKHYQAVLRGGLSGTAVGLGVGLGASLIFQRRWQLYRSLTLPFKAFFVSSAGTFAAIINADHYSRGFEASRHADLNQFQDNTARRIFEQQANLTKLEKTKNWAREYRYPIVTTSWVASMAVSLGIVSRNKYLNTAQKLVQSRVYAQGLTLLVLVATAVFEVSDSRKKKANDLARIADSKDPGKIEKRIHHENYAGEDLWKGLVLHQAIVAFSDKRVDMVEAEERRLESRRKISTKP